MGQCVTKCKNPTSSLGSKSGEKDAGKSHGKKGGGGTGSAHKEEVAKSSDVIFNGTKVSEVTVEGTTAPAVSADVWREQSAQDGEGVSLARIDELFLCYKDEYEDAILEEGMECFCNDLCVDPAEFKVLVLAWKFQAATMCKFTRWVSRVATVQKFGVGVRFFFYVFEISVVLSPKLHLFYQKYSKNVEYYCNLKSVFYVNVC